MPSRFHRSRRPLRSKALLSVALVSLLGTSPALAGPAQPAPLAWSACASDARDIDGQALDAAGARCAAVTVPVDPMQPDGRTIEIAISRVAAKDPARRRGVLLLNPGGPGVAGLGLPAAIASAVPRLAQRYDLIGFDPRFVGRSHALSCGWSTSTFIRGAGPGEASFARAAAYQRRLAEECARAGVDLLPFASTRNTARDMDAVRAALGEARISYLGVSYGTYLGATYLQMFGDHADRFVLDSAVSPTRYGPGLLTENAVALRAALRHWAQWAARRDRRYGLGRSRDAVLSVVEQLRRRIDRAPLAVGGSGRVDAATYPYLLFALLPDDAPASYAGLADVVRALRAARGGDGPAHPSAALTELLEGLRNPSPHDADPAGTPILCADRAVASSPASYLADIDAHRHAEPLFEPLTRNITPCAFWPVAPSEPATTIANAWPALIVGAEGDPLTPLPGQLEMHRALQGSRLLTLRGAYRHGAWLEAGSRCIDRAVSGYLIDGTLPATDRRCPAVDGPS